MGVQTCALPISKKRDSCGWSDPKVLKERFLIEWKDADGNWRENYSWERGAVYLVKGRNGNGNILTVYHLDLRDRTNIKFRLVESDSAVTNDGKLKALIFPNE